jgi:hypothetical protein
VTVSGPVLPLSLFLTLLLPLPVMARPHG